MSPWAHYSPADVKNEVGAYRANKVDDARLNRRTSVGYAVQVLGHVGIKGCLLYYVQVHEIFMVPKDDFIWNLMREAGPLESASYCCCGAVSEDGGWFLYLLACLTAMTQERASLSRLNAHRRKLQDGVGRP